ncbi:sigma-54 interaction domain-containing protein [Calycomorphotria hydatis]|uniref:Transcriptional regulatory protein ZraR n=1 Tax=Calycomorphotria hydatis TaxID=2528027 RepID=A0A517T9N0_9PLAN|nr:sigma-54 dependent transcriptional regulator [Calycomorphotria hydatis]QDT65078.1 Transcriptional regulatory protein ZraR [Calycomorphotria hydatis]
MNRPKVALLSSRAVVLEELAAALQHMAEPLLLDDPLNGHLLLKMNQPQLVLVDCSPGEIAESQLVNLLYEIRAALPETKLLAILPDLCSQDFAQATQQCHIESIARSLTAEAIASRVEKHISPAPSSESKPKREESAKLEKQEVPIEQQPARAELNAAYPKQPETSERVLSGITRSFETNNDDLKLMLEELEVAAQHDVTVLLIGETGSGKTFLSRLIHEVSNRKEEPFLTVACGALPADLIESELFGHVKGAFTGAHADKEGKFIAAGRGTVLLDEIDVLGPEQQVKLLRVIETGEFEPVGSNQTYRCQARLVVASNLELKPLVSEGRFRPDLYYRLNMLKFNVPPLRTRPEDLQSLAEKFVKLLSGKHNVLIDKVERSFYEALQLYPWPGNVRELENVVRRAVIYCRDGELTARHLPPHIIARDAGPTNDPSVMLGEAQARDKSLENQVASSEREIIEQTLFRNNFSRTNTAKALGISRVTLYNKMKKYGILK